MLAKNAHKKLFSFTIILAVFCFLLLIPASYLGTNIVKADVLDSTKTNLGKALGFAGQDLGFNESGAVSSPVSLPVLIGRLFQVVLAIVGIAYMGLLIYGGYCWFTAGGDSEAADKANKILGNASWGLIIILIAFTITTYIVMTLTTQIIGTP
jgi:hypothetical protein